MSAAPWRRRPGGNRKPPLPKGGILLQDDASTAATSASETSSAVSDDLTTSSSPARTWSDPAVVLSFFWTLVRNYVFLPLLAFAIMMVLTTVSAFLLLFGTKDNDPSVQIPDFPTEPLDENLRKNKKWRGVHPKVIDASAVSFRGEQGKALLRGFLDRGEPVIVKNLDSHLDIPAEIENLQRDRNASSEKKSTNLFIELNIWPFLPLGENLSKFIHDYCGGRQVLFAARFAGGYKAGFGHMDSFPSYNFYYVTTGCKQVYLVPRQFNPSRLNHEEENKLSFQPGVDNVRITGDTADGESLGNWLSRVPAVYDFKVEQLCRESSLLRGFKLFKVDF